MIDSAARWPECAPMIQTLTVREACAETPLVRRIVLAGPCPAFEAGAHVRVETPAGSRAYSLVDLPGRGGDWVLGVRLEDASSGGSAHMHGLRVGDEITLSGPENHFPLEHNGPVLLIAGGIGITPILSMAAECLRTECEFSLHYYGRAPGTLAFVTELETMCGDRLHLHYDTDGVPDFEALMFGQPAGRAVYVCGPSGMIDAVRAATRGPVHSELFVNAPEGEDTAFEVEVKSTGQIVTVPPGMTIIEALEAEGLDIVYDCQRGDCGICQTDVLDGIPDHRDVVLSDAEKAAGNVMQICVSRARTPRLVLDL